MSNSFDWKLDGAGYGQSTAESCWFASYALLFKWKGSPISSIRERIEKAGLNFTDYYQNGLPIADFPKTRNALGLTSWRGSYIATLASDFEAFAQLLKGYGPLWCAFSRPHAHIVVVIGVNGDAGTIHILNPWDNTNGIDAESQYLTSSKFLSRLNGKDSAVGQAFM